MDMFNGAEVVISPYMINGYRQNETAKMDDRMKYFSKGFNGVYQSPIEKIYGEIQSDIARQEEDALVATVTREVGYKVDKDELIKALKYDRHQYEKGYYEGLHANKWHPVTEEPPELDKEYLTCNIYGSMDVCFWTKDGWTICSLHEDNVRYWQPLPDTSELEF